MSTKEPEGRSRSAREREERRVYTKADLDAAIKIWKGEASKPELEPHKPRRERTPTRRAWIRSLDGEEGRVHDRAELDDIIKRLEGEASKPEPSPRREHSPRHEPSREREPAHEPERPTRSKAGRVVFWLAGMGVLIWALATIAETVALVSEADEIARNAYWLAEKNQKKIEDLQSEVTELEYEILRLKKPQSKVTELEYRVLSLEEQQVPKPVRKPAPWPAR